MWPRERPLQSSQEEHGLLSFRLARGPMRGVAGRYFMCKVSVDLVVGKVKFHMKFPSFMKFLMSRKMPHLSILNLAVAAVA